MGGHTPPGRTLRSGYSILTGLGSTPSEVSSLSVSSSVDFVSDSDRLANVRNHLRIAAYIVVGHSSSVSSEQPRQRYIRSVSVPTVDTSSRMSLCYLGLLKINAEQYGLTIHASCLMTNHVHIVATPSDEVSVAKGIGRTHYLYTRYVNKFHGRSGHLWQNRFLSCSLDEFYFLNTVHYIERNPVWARMVRKVLRYPWSSADVHVAGQDSSGLLWISEWPAYYKGERWSRQLEEPEGDELIGTNRNRTFKGHPSGSDRFISKIETLVGRGLRAGPMGRPRKKTTLKKKRRRK